jgi:hypothetical protein
MTFFKTGKAKQIGDALKFSDGKITEEITKEALKPEPACKRTAMHAIPEGETKCTFCGEDFRS